MAFLIVCKGRISSYQSYGKGVGKFAEMEGPKTNAAEN